MTALFLRPDADQSDGGWLNESASGTNIYQSVDESTLSDTDYIQSSTTDGDKVRLGLSDPSAGVTAPLIVRYRCKRVGTVATNLIGRLYQGTGPGTLIATWTVLALPDSFTTYTYTLTSGEFAAISDFTNLYVEFELSQQSSLKVDLNFAAGNYYDSGTVSDATGMLSCTRSSIGYANTSSGTLTQFAANALRITDLGLLVENARTNVVLWNQDLTNAAWTKTNITAALDQTGPDGVANSASSITATASNGTVLQAITLASSARYQSAWIKRITGSGTINMTMDNGSTWTAVTVTSSWTLAQIPTQTLANPTVGVRIVTNGDAVAVDFVQNEDGTFASSPIPTTSAAVTRAADSLSMIGSLATVLGACDTGVSAVVDAGPAPTFGGHRWQLFEFSSNGWSLEWYDGSSDVVFMDDYGLGKNYGGSYVASSIKTGGSHDAGGRTISANGVSATDATTKVAGTGPILGAVGGGPDQPMFYFKRLTVWNSRLSDATLNARTAP